ncbi:unnamed protein product [Paramecium sonneborni]|uniref:Uncharacterized protein n=1 Tax=Paramecium sonneborni TaxID=65129 RepID=A0A8S1L5Y0_9CILI|nr:unnamed protein product [Paramecium sonneborni]
MKNKVIKKNNQIIKLLSELNLQNKSKYNCDKLLLILYNPLNIDNNITLNNQRILRRRSDQKSTKSK